MPITRPSATLRGSGHVMTTGMRNAKSTVTPAKASAGLRIYLRVFRGVHKAYLHLYSATYEAMINTKRVTPALIRRMCFSRPSAQ